MFGDPAFGEVKFIKIFDDMLNSKKFKSRGCISSVDCNFETYDFKTDDNTQRELINIINTHKFPYNVEWVKENPNDFNSDESFEQYMTYRFLQRFMCVELEVILGTTVCLSRQFLQSLKNVVLKVIVKLLIV